MFRPRSHLGVLADHVEPEDGRPGALLLAGVGDDDHGEGGGLRKMAALKLATKGWLLRQETSGRNLHLQRDAHVFVLKDRVKVEDVKLLRHTERNLSKAQIIIVTITGISSTVTQTLADSHRCRPFRLRISAPSESENIS